MGVFGGLWGIYRKAIIAKESTYSRWYLKMTQHCLAATVLPGSFQLVAIPFPVAIPRLDSHRVVIYGRNNRELFDNQQPG